MDLNSVSVHKLAKKDFSQYPAILTLHLVNNSICITLSYDSNKNRMKVQGPHPKTPLKDQIL